jgi:ABC-2 type transport system ATP-binding protein
MPLTNWTWVSSSSTSAMLTEGCVVIARVPIAILGALGKEWERAMPVVELKDVRKAYDKKVAVNQLDLRIEAGTMFGLLGPNGSGKTSTIRMMIGITVPDAGTVKLFGEPFSQKLLGRVGYLPEERGLYKKMVVLDQLVFLGQLRGLSAGEAQRRSRAWCERLQIADAMQKKTEELSKGMQQKIQFIATLLHDPELIIMDEPFSGLDPVNATLLQDTLLELHKEGRTILFSTHRMDQVEKMCDAISLIHNGNVVLSGSMREVKSRNPQNRVVIQFEGDDAFVRHEAVEQAKSYHGVAELKLKSNGDSQALLMAAAGMARITRFEVMEPTLEEIFIEAVGGKVDA